MATVKIFILNIQRNSQMYKPPTILSNHFLILILVFRLQSINILAMTPVNRFSKHKKSGMKV